jgi:hypothetical protein
LVKIEFSMSVEVADFLEHRDVEAVGAQAGVEDVDRRLEALVGLLRIDVPVGDHHAAVGVGRLQGHEREDVQGRAPQVAVDADGRRGRGAGHGGAPAMTDTGGHRDHAEADRQDPRGPHRTHTTDRHALLLQHCIHLEIATAPGGEPEGDRAARAALSPTEECVYNTPHPPPNENRVALGPQGVADCKISTENGRSSVDRPAVEPFINARLTKRRYVAG